MMKNWLTQGKSLKLLNKDRIRMFT